MATKDVETGPATDAANVAAFKEQSLRRKSLKVQLQEKKAESSGPLAFVLACCCIVSGSIGFTILIGIMMAIPIASIAIGAVHLNDCPIQRFIPIYLIVAGCFCIVNMISRIVRRACFHPPEGEEGNVNVQRDVKSNLFESIITVFIFAWFIAGSVWIYGCYEAVRYDKVAPYEHLYCDKVLYLYAFWITMITYIFLLLSFCCCCLACICHSFK